MNTIDIEDSLGIQFCKRQALAIEGGAGSRVWDAAGRNYLDFTSGWGVTSLGHCHPVLTRAISHQAARLTQNPNSGFTYSPVRAALLERLVPVLPKPLRRLYFVNSGAEANDAAIKMARLLTGRVNIVSTEQSFHGRTHNTLSVSTGAESASRFPPRLATTTFVPHGDLEAMAGAISTETAAAIVEPVQGEGGVRIPSDSYLAAVGKLCKRNGALLIIDEIQTGFCRTGSFFAIEQCDPPVEPDMLTMGKGLGGGFPIAALAMSEACASKVSRGDHGGTYCGNPLACAAALAVVGELIDGEVAARVGISGCVLGELLAGIGRLYPDIVREVRGRGLLWALQFDDDEVVEQVTAACLQGGLMVTPTRNGIVRLLPSLLVSEDEIREAAGILGEALASVRESEYALDCSAH